MGWKDKDNTFKDSLSSILVKIDQLHPTASISILGISAGGSLALNTLYQSDHVDYVVNLCGRLRVGNNKFRSLDRVSKSSSVFKDSVISSDQILNNSVARFKGKVMCIASKYYDELVPLDTSHIDELENIKVPIIGHILSIYYILFFKKKLIFDFISNKQKRLD